jgi:hypothetical protein
VSFKNRGNAIRAAQDGQDTKTGDRERAGDHQRPENTPSMAVPQKTFPFRSVYPYNPLLSTATGIRSAA